MRRSRNDAEVLEQEQVRVPVRVDDEEGRDGPSGALGGEAVLRLKSEGEGKKKTSEEEVEEVDQSKKIEKKTISCSPHRALSLSSLADSERSRPGDSHALEPKP